MNQPINDDGQLVSIIDELYFRLKAGGYQTKLQKDFRRCLWEFIAKHNLDENRHHFATLPKEKING